jgi:eukaryotic-like serine/threonine-protein kinase
MKVDDWQQIEELFHAALNYTAEDRAGYLAQACAGDEVLRREIESLIRAFEKEQSFMEQPALSLGMKVLSEAMAGTLVGKTFGQYKIVSLLGQGGMGEVYLAEDHKLDRKVALKFFANKFMDDEWGRRLLTKEARAVAMLDHPNISAVYGIEEIEGYSFIVMQYIEGETLSSLLRRELIAIKRLLDVSEQLVSALSAAHAQGIIHRDIKPQNIVVAKDGQVKVLDFGLAKIIQQTQDRSGTVEEQSQFSQAGVIAGTVAYMSPEQLRAEELDYRSDIFSVGILLYELISGKNPYAHETTAETISAILTEHPSPLARATTKIPRELDRIVHKCLEKNKERRYNSANELLSELRGLQNTSRRRIHPGLRGVAAIALLIFLMVGLISTYLHLTQTHTVAILPLINEIDDPSSEYLGYGLTESLVDQLSRLPKLRVKAVSFVPDYGGDRNALQKIGRELKVEAVLVERVQRRGESSVLQVNLMKTEDGSTLWAEEYDLQKVEISTLQRKISEQVASTLQLWVSSDEKKLLARSSTENPEAFKLYLWGRHYWDKRDKENIQKAIDYFQQATDQDPSFALAWAGLADSYALLPTVAYGSVPTEEAMPKAVAAARKALEIDGTLCEAHISLGVVLFRYYWKWQEAEQEFKKAIELNPGNASAHYWYANLLGVTGRFNEAIAESKTAKEIDPFSLLVITNLGRAYYRAHEYDKASEYLKRVLEENPKNSSAAYVLGYVYIQKEMYGEAIETLEKLSTTRKWLAAAPLGYAYAKAGRKADALKILADMEEQSKKEDPKEEKVPSQERAIVYIGLDDKDQAFLWLKKSYEERFASIISLTSDPIFNSLRSDSRFADLTRKVNLTP